MAEGIAVHYQASMSEAERCQRALTAFDKFITPRGGMLPGLVRDVLLAEPKDLRVPVSGLGDVSTEAWRAAGDALKADVQAKSSMDDLLPAAKPQRPPITFTLNITPAEAIFQRIDDDPEPPVASDPEAA
jgi:hypothetical protein